MKDKDFAVLATGMAVGAIVGATWLTVLERNITALDTRMSALDKLMASRWENELKWIGKHIDGKNELWDKVMLLSSIVNEQKSRLDALEDAGAVATPRTPMPYMPSIVPHVQLDFPGSTPVIWPNQGTLITSNQWGEVWAVPADQARLGALEGKE